MFQEFRTASIKHGANTSQSPHASAQGTVTKVKGFEDGLKEALLTKGPMTVSVDAGAESFRFYKRGIYNNTACHTVPVTGGVSDPHTHSR